MILQIFNNNAVEMLMNLKEVITIALCYSDEMMHLFVQKILVMDKILCFYQQVFKIPLLPSD